MGEKTLLITDAATYRTIVEEAAAHVKKSIKTNRRPNPHHQGGFILTPEPDRFSFKQALIAVAFAGIYIEVLIRIATQRMRKTRVRFVSKAVEKGRYNGRLEAVGINDHTLLKAAAHFNDVRDDLIHEKPFELSLERNAKNHFPHIKQYVAQDEALKAVKLIRQIAKALRPKG